MRGRRRIRITTELLGVLVNARPNEDGGLFRGISSDAPDDLYVESVLPSEQLTHTFDVIVSSETWEPSNEGALPEIVEITFTTHYGEATHADAA